ncbi:MAG TPA: hypothetical protein VMI06_10275 [Terriglobia bacterium]|nr:hypothetical protein [Terriglobia bacterium]
MIAPLIGMRFLSFLSLLILSAVAAAVLHWAFRYRFFDGAEGFFGGWIVGWICAWLGPAVFGHWFGPIMLWNIYVIPALLGAFAGTFLTTAACRVAAAVWAPRGGIESIGQHHAA